MNTLQDKQHLNTQQTELLETHLNKLLEKFRNLLDTKERDADTYEELVRIKEYINDHLDTLKNLWMENCLLCGHNEDIENITTLNTNKLLEELE